LNQSFNTLNEISCNQYISPSAKVFTSSGSYIDTIPNNSGCDSIITINLTILKSTYNSININTCGNFISPSGKTISMSGSYIDTIPNNFGCDSIIDISLNITQIDTSIIINGNTMTAKSTGSETYQWIQCDQNNTAINGATSYSYTPTHDGKYAVIITNENCSDTSNCYTITGTAIENISSRMEMNIYPNPANEHLTIQFDNLQQYVIVEFYNIRGQKIFYKEYINISNAEINVGSIDAGIYLINVSNGERSIHKKLIIQ